MSDNEHEKSFVEIEDKQDHKPGKLRSLIWEHFTVIDRKNHVAVCNTCGNRLSYKTTVSNLKKHIERKHPHGTVRRRYVDRSQSQRPRPTFDEERNHKVRKPINVRKSKLTELGGLEGLVLNIIGEDGETVVEHEGNQQEVYVSDVHEYSAAENHEDERLSKDQRVSRPQKKSNSERFDSSEKIMRNRLLDLQLECLEIKKYNMQLESLMLEQQLNIRRSIFTEPLQYTDSVTRGTQTEVGGEKTQVFYMTDGKGGVPTRHLFAVQEFD